MTFEFKNCVKANQKATKKGLKTVMASLVALNGSSYRKPGVRMLIVEDGTMVGAVSGGCVEKEILRQSETVFDTNESKMMTYGGRYRLGCEGMLFILIEPFNPNDEFIAEFDKTVKDRKSFHIKTYYSKSAGENANWGSLISFENKKSFGFSKDQISENMVSSKFSVFEQKLAPCFRLVIVGSEHDAVKLSLFASYLGWEVVVVTNATNQQTRNDFPGVQQLIQVEPNQLNLNRVNEQTAIVFMTHSYAKDLQYLLALKDTNPIYIGFLGPYNRREKIISDLIEQYPEVEDSFLEKMYGPAGLNIGAETSQEIAVSICSEILSVTRKQQPDFLKNKLTSIHS